MMTKRLMLIQYPGSPGKQALMFVGNEHTPDDAAAAAVDYTKDERWRFAGVRILAGNLPMYDTGIEVLRPYFGVASDYGSYTPPYWEYRVIPVYPPLGDGVKYEVAVVVYPYTSFEVAKAVEDIGMDDTLYPPQAVVKPVYCALTEDVARGALDYFKEMFPPDKHDPVLLAREIAAVAKVYLGTYRLNDIQISQMHARSYNHHLISKGDFERFNPSGDALRICQFVLNYAK